MAESNFIEGDLATLKLQKSMIYSEILDFLPLQDLRSTSLIKHLTQVKNSSFQNQLILSKIFGHLPFKDLESTCLVNRFWEQESKKDFQQRAAILFEKDKFLNDEKYNIILQTHQHFKWIFNPENLVNKEKWLLFRNKLIEFQAIQRNSIKSLQISANLKNANELLHLKDILLVQHLKILELNFEGFKENDFLECTEILNNIQPLLHVSKLQLNFGNLSPGFYQDMAVGRFSRNLLKLTPNICQLQTSFSDRCRFQMYLQEILKLQLEVATGKSLPFKNLSSLNFEKWNCKVSNACLELQQPLVFIKATKISLKQEDSSNALQTFLQKNSKTLQSLSLSFDEWKSNAGQIILLPCFPRLTHLSISVSNEFSEETNADVCGIRKLLSSLDEFEKVFPKLKSLKLNMGKKWDENEVFGIFLPDSDTGIKTWGQFGKHFYCKL